MPFPTYWSPYLYLCWIIVASIRGALGLGCPSHRSWGTCSFDCKVDEDCEGILLCCVSKCGKNCVEPDYNPPLQPSQPTGSRSGSSNNQSGGGALAWYWYGLIVLVLILIIMVVVAAFILLRRRKNRNQRRPTMANTNTTLQAHAQPTSIVHAPARARAPKLADEDVYCYIDDAAVSDVTNQNVAMETCHAPPLRQVSEADWSEMDFYDESVMGDEYPPNPNENYYVTAVQHFRPR